MSHCPTPHEAEPPPRSSTDAITRLQSLLSSVALPKSKTAKTISVSLATFQDLRNLCAEALRLASPIDMLSTKIDSLAKQIIETREATRTYAEVAASESAKKHEPSQAVPPALPPSVFPHEPPTPRYDFILRQLDYKNPVLSSNSPADIQCKINDILATSNLLPEDSDHFPLRVRAVAKLRNGNIRLLWHNQWEQEYAKMNCETWLSNLSDQLEVFDSSYRVVVHGVPLSTFTLDSELGRNEALTALVCDNEYIGKAEYAEDHLSGIQWMSRRVQPPSKTHSSLIVCFREPQLANLAIEHGVAIEGRLLRAQRFHSLPTQCYNCHRFGHVARYCKSPSKCGRCASAHATSACSCPSEHACDNMSQCNQPKCALCRGAHYATARDCPVRANVFARCLSGHQTFGRYFYVPDI